MRTIGIIGGMSWESTALYYKLINEGVREHLGGLHSASILLDSCDFAGMEELQTAGDWETLGRILSEKALKLQDAGAEGILIATNSMHEVADGVEGAISVPFLHIADAVGEALIGDGFDIVGLLGTSFTMERPFYTGRLKERFGIDALIPESDERNQVHRIIYKELCRGVVDDSSKHAYLKIMDELVRKGAQAIVLGCTEIGLLVGEGDTKIPLYDTARLHAEAAVEWMLE
ncbi:aspartate/glutamate racemase family protein [bacterium]|nr:aspartate/glutamate racemase family protein [bacterium]